MELQYIVFGIYTLAFVGVFIYQANRYSSLEKSLKALNDMLDSISKYKDLFKPDDIIDRMNTKHKLETEVLEQTWEKRMNEKLNEQKFGLSQDLIHKVTKEFIKMNTEIIERLGELAQHPIAYIITAAEFKNNKNLRDKYIRDNFPKNADYFIESCDLLLKNQKKD
jgi:hypothetical protein